MRVLIAGGAGFIGSHLARWYARDNHDVVVIDNLLTSAPWAVETLRPWRNITFQRHDVCEPLPTAMGKFDRVFDMACPASPVDFGPRALAILRVCSQGVRHLLELVRHCGSECRFLQASTSECYGDPLVHPQVETYWGHVNPIGPRSCYDEGKRFAEALTMNYHRTYGLKTHLARIFNTYGPDMRLDDGRVLPNFCCQALRGEPLTVYGDGSQTRSLCYVDDLVDGLVRLIETDYAEPVNVGNPQEISMADLAREIIALTQSQSTIEFRPLPTDDPKQRCPDITLAGKVMGWKPTTPRSLGIAKTVGYFRERLGEVRPS